jgi:hypothetical protein
MAMLIRDKQIAKYRDEENKKPLVWYEIIVDKVSELPTSPIASDEEIAQGSIAWVVETGEFYGYTSTGTWVNQTQMSEEDEAKLTKVLNTNNLQKGDVR